MRTLCTCLVVALALVIIPTARAQGTSGPVGTGGSAVGYVENAIPGTQVRIRFDSAFDANRPNRSEFLYATGQRLGPGLPMAERSVDFQEASAYVELLLGEGVSGFADLPMRFLNPEINDNHAGLGDVAVGLKYALHADCESVASLLLKAYLPTGDAGRGLGTDHCSLEIGILAYRRLGDRLAFEGELRYWLPLGGTDGYAGSILRYGLGLQYRAMETCSWSLTPVVELVGWTALDGRSRFAGPLGGPAIEADARGDTILNAKLGTRLNFSGSQDLYLGYGHAITGDRWYREVLRLEWRIIF